MVLHRSFILLIMSELCKSCCERETVRKEQIQKAELFIFPKLLIIFMYKTETDEANHTYESDRKKNYEKHIKKIRYAS